MAKNLYYCHYYYINTDYIILKTSFTICNNEVRYRELIYEICYKRKIICNLLLQNRKISMIPWISHAQLTGSTLQIFNTNFHRNWPKNGKKNMKNMICSLSRQSRHKLKHETKF